jgi:hypothetical protein
MPVVLRCGCSLQAAYGVGLRHRPGAVTIDPKLPSRRAATGKRLPLGFGELAVSFAAWYLRVIAEMNRTVPHV